MFCENYSKSETERIIYEDTDPCNGFVLLPDLKWSDPSQVHMVESFDGLLQYVR